MSKQRTFLSLRGASRGQPPPDPSQIAIEGYRIVGLIGAGPLTAVYRAVLESHQQEVVVKVLLPYLAESEVFVQRFLQAANAARLVTHDRVLSCYDVGQSNGWVYLATEPVEGERLDALIAQGAIERGRAVYFAWQIAMGLEAVHGAGLVHGNLRPSNVLVDSEDGVRLADLGLPVMSEGESAASAATPATLHLPPEGIAGDAPDQRGDIYALGVVLLGALLGRTPWDGLSRLKIQELHARGRQVLDEAPAGLLDADLGAVLARATASRPEERYAEAWQLREDLERLQYQFAPIHARPVDGAGGASASREAAIRSTRAVQEPVVGPVRPGRSRLWIALAAAVVCLLALLGLLLSADRRPGPPAAIPVAAPVATSAIPPAPVAAAAPKPVWASATGSDAHGRWADLVCGAATQRMRLIPAGNFWMGSAGDEAARAADEDRHLVTLSRSFWLGDTEVTQALYAAVAGLPPAHFQAADRPVESVSWNTVQDFLAQLGGRTGAPIRLPSEAEWEYACRAGGEAPVLPGPDRAWTADSGVDGTRPVARLRPNAYGLFDMQGNVMEWVADTYARYHRESTTDPLSTGGVHRVTRGGAWNLDPMCSRPAARSKALPVAAFFYLGFRIAISD